MPTRGSALQVGLITMTSREVNRDVGKAKRQARDVAVAVANRGRAAHGLLTTEDCVALPRQGASIVDLLAMPESEGIEFEPPRIDAGLYRPADLARPDGDR